MLGERFYKVVVSSLITILILGNNDDLLAQTSTPDHKIYDLVYGSLLKYERKSTFRTSNQMKAFENLFEDPDCLIPNDVLADNNLDKKISIYQYAQIRSKYCRFPYKVNLDILEFSSINYINDSSTAEVKVIVNKQISNKYLKEKGQIYHYKDTFKFEIIYHINLKSLNPLISEINYTEPPGKYARITFFQKGIKQILFDGSIYDIADTNEIFMKRLDTIKPKKIIALDRRFLGAEKINLSSLQRKKKKDKRLWDKNQVPIHFKQSFITLGGKYSFIPGVKSNYIFPKQDNISTRIGNEGNEFNILPIGLAARDSLRIEMGYCLYGNEIDENTSPIEAGLSWITRTETNFYGSSFIEEDIKKGCKYMITGIKSEERIIPRKGNIILNSDKEKIGRITSGTFSPTLKTPIGIGFILKDKLNYGEEVFVDNNRKIFKAKIYSLPFIKS